tara:strand:- start:1057 stop:5052 length:3996 start_codon:yes stop_codon:yes gene_type:complete
VKNNEVNSFYKLAYETADSDFIKTASEFEITSIRRPLDSTMQTYEKELVLLRKIDEIADRFESEWSTQQRPRIEDWVSHVKGNYQPRLLAELIAIELEWRAGNGESLVLDEYLNRFPEQKPVVEKVFSVWQQSTSLEATGDFKPAQVNTLIPPTGLTPSESLSSGKLFLDRFQLQQKLGHGGFGSVYEAYDILLGRSVALKVPHPGANDDTRQRFLSEARAAGKLRHNHIVTVFDGGDTDGTLYIVCELIDGNDLAQRIKNCSPSLKQLISWVRDAAYGLAYAHREGVVHRDIKPANLLVSSDNRILVADFGLARRCDDNSSLTIDGSVFGTPAYMSPEQAVGNTAGIGPASDQYNLGVVLYELLTGRLPFHGNNIQQILYQIQNQEAPAPRTLHAAVPEDLEAICLKSMSRDPSDRYSDLDAFAADLQRWLNHEPVHARPVSFTERMRRRMKRHPLVSALTVATITLLFISGITGALSWYRGHQIGEIQELANKVGSQLTVQKEELLSQEQELKRSRKAVTLIQDKVIEKTKAADQNRYRVLIRQISEDIQRGRMQPDILRRLLDECPEHLRDWEWFYFDHLLQPKSELLFSSKRPLRDAALSPDGLCLAVIDDRGSVKVILTEGGPLENEWQSKAIDVQQIAWDPSGKRLAIADKLNKLRIWDARTGQLLSTFGNQDFLFGATAGEGEFVAPEVSQLVQDHLNRLRKYVKKQTQKIPESQRTHELRHEFQKKIAQLENNPLLNGFLNNDPLVGIPKALHSLEGYGWAVAFDSTGNRVAVGGDRFVQIWDLNQKRRTHLLLATKNTYVTSLAFSSDDHRLLVGTYHGETIIFNSEDGTEILRKETQVFRTHFTPVWAPSTELVFVPVSGGEVGAIGLADKILRTPTECHRGETNALELSADGNYVASAGTDNTIRVWHAEALQLAKSFLTNSIDIRRLQFFENNSKLMSCSPQEVRIWEIDSLTPKLQNRRIYQWEADQSDVIDPVQEASIDETVTKVMVSPDDRFIAMVIDDVRLMVRELATGREVVSFPDPEMLRSGTQISGTPQFDPQGRWLAVAAHGTEVIAKENKPRPFGGFSNRNTVKEQETQKTYDLKIWTMPNWESRTIQLSQTPYLTNYPGFLRVSPEGNILAYSRSHELFLLDAGDFTTKWSLKTDSPIRCLDFSPSSKSLAFKCANGQIPILSVASGKMERQLGVQGAPEPSQLIPIKSMLDLDFSPDGKLLATSDTEGNIILWDVEAGAEHARLEGHLSRIDALAFHPSGTRLVSASEDHTIRIWDIKNGEELGLLSDLPRNYYLSGGLSFTSEGRELYAAENGLFLRFDAGPVFLKK